jgi:hypothetical protein
VGRASTNKKVQRAARAGGRAKVRSGRGTVFPASVAAVAIVGVGLIAYARQSSSLNEPPTVDQHWHVAFGINKCGTELAPIQNNNESAGTEDALLYQASGIHSHSDGVIHIHPFGSAGTGKNAKLGTWFKQVGITTSADKVELPEGLGTLTQDEDCPAVDGGEAKPGKLKVLVWKNADSTGEPDVYITGFDDVRFTNDAMAITLALVPDGTDLKTLKPRTAANLAELGAVDIDASDPAATQPTTTTPSGESTTTGATTTGATTTTTAKG